MYYVPLRRHLVTGILHSTALKSPTRPAFSLPPLPPHSKAVGEVVHDSRFKAHLLARWYAKCLLVNFAQAIVSGFDRFQGANGEGLASTLQANVAMWQCRWCRVLKWCSADLIVTGAYCMLDYVLGTFLLAVTSIVPRKIREHESMLAWLVIIRQCDC